MEGFDNNIMKTFGDSLAEALAEQNPEKENEAPEGLEEASGFEKTDFVPVKAPVHAAPVFEKIKEVPEVEKPMAEVGVISGGTTIEGDIVSKGHLNIDGIIKGSVTALGDVIVTGDVSGDINCNNLLIKGGNVRANLNAKGDVTIVAGACVNGNVAGKKVDLEGTVNGNITAEISTQIAGVATVCGDITTGDIAVGMGAELQGNIRTMKK